MKKILLSVLLISAVIFCVPKLAFAAVMELTVTITSIQIPERAAMELKNVNTEFEFSTNSRIVIVKNSDGSIANWGSPSGQNIFSSLRAGSVTVLPFSYSSSNQYSVYIERRVSGQVGASKACTAACNTVTSASWYYFPIDYSGGADSNCPASTCTASYRYFLGFPPESTVLDGTIRYWRSPALAAINQ